MRIKVRGENAKILCYVKAAIGWSFGLFCLVGGIASGDSIVGVIMFILAVSWGTIKFYKAKRIEEALYPKSPKPDYHDYHEIEEFNNKMQMVEDFMATDEFKEIFRPTIQLIEMQNEIESIKKKELMEQKAKWSCQPGEYIKITVPFSKWSEYMLEFNNISIGDEVILQRIFDNVNAPNAIKVSWNKRIYGYLPVKYINSLSPKIFDSYNLETVKGNVIGTTKESNNKITAIDIGCHLPSQDFLEFYRDNNAVNDYWDNLADKSGY